LSRRALLLDLGRRDYGEVWQLQKQLCERRQRDEIPDVLILCEHPDTITLGRRQGSARNVLCAGDTPLFEVERGGDVTYHGPGQLVGYPILALAETERDLHRYLRSLEEVLIRALARFGISAGREPGKTGVWARHKKLASLGVAIRRWVTLHGFALNVTTDLARFGAINPCGMDAAVMGSILSLTGCEVALREVAAEVAVRFEEVLERPLLPTPLASLASPEPLIPRIRCDS
jgi:lipoate-protein ligase B